MSRWATKRFIGIQDDDSNTHRWDNLCLAFGNEAVIPAEVELASYRIAPHDEKKNKEGIRIQLDLLDEVRVTVEQRMTCQQYLMAKHYNTKAEP